MAARVNDCGEFLVIGCSAAEMNAAVGSPGICDYCGEPARTGYYVAVLNRWFCPKCYAAWRKRAKYYPSDKAVEERNYRYYAEKLRVP